MKQKATHLRNKAEETTEFQFFVCWIPCSRLLVCYLRTQQTSVSHIK